jgi:hypothetical protein
MSVAAHPQRIHMLTSAAHHNRFIFAYGLLLYQLLGDDAEASFVRSWGVSYGLNAATEWKASPRHRSRVYRCIDSA